MPSKLLEALRPSGPITPQIEGPSDYQRNKQLIEILRLASLGSSTHLHMMERMSSANKATAWTFSKADTKARIKALYGASVENGCL